MPEKRKCEGCGEEYWWPACRWQHQDCKPLAEPEKPRRGRPRTVQDPQTYRREYMREWRARKKGIEYTRPIPPCVVCGKPAKSRGSKFCEDCQWGAKPASVEYAVFAAIRDGKLKPAKECICVDCGAQGKTL